MAVKERAAGSVAHNVPMKTLNTSLKVMTGKMGGVKEGTVCHSCGVVYRHKHWEHAEEGRSYSSNHQGKVILCPACLKIKGKNPSGVVTLKWKGLSEHKGDLLNLIRNVGERAFQTNALERIMKIRESGNSIEVETTSGVLSQRVGRAIEKAYHGELSYRWSKNEKLVRIQWEGGV